MTTNCVDPRTVFVTSVTSVSSVLRFLRSIAISRHLAASSPVGAGDLLSRRGDDVVVLEAEVLGDDLHRRG